MTLTIHLLGRPSIDRPDSDVYRYRSRKSWAVLAHLITSRRAPSRTELASLLFSQADDPRRALRWSLNEVRRSLGDTASVGGDPVTLDLPEDTVVDVEVVTRGAWTDAVQLPGLGAELLEGMSFGDSPAFESWLLSERRHIAGATEAILHEAALASMSRGAWEQAVEYSVRVVALNPLEENHQALLIRAYRLAGDNEAAEEQLQACIDLFRTELQIDPGPAVLAASRSSPTTGPQVDMRTSVEAVLEAGSAAVAAGAVDSGVDSLRTGVTMADKSQAHRLRVTSRLALAEALIHSVRGEDEEGSAILHAAREIADSEAEPELGALARVELGYVDFLRARYDRSEQWLRQAIELSPSSLPLVATATTYLAGVESDRANYPESLRLIDRAIELTGAVEDLKRQAYAYSLTGRIHLLQGHLDQAARLLETSIELCQVEQWLAFLPWPQALRGEVELRRGNLDAASEILEQAFARACQVGDPCWEGASARARALVAEARGDSESAFRGLSDSQARCNRHADTYVWMNAYILDAQCELGVRHSHPNTKRWVDALADLASRTEMREFVVRSHLHRHAMGEDGALETARLLASDIDNPSLSSRLETLDHEE